MSHHCGRAHVISIVHGDGTACQLMSGVIARQSISVDDGDHTISHRRMKKGIGGG